MRKKCFFRVIASVLLLSFIASAQKVMERYKLGNTVEDLTYISQGKLAGKLVVRDALNVNSYDLNSGRYEKLFSLAGLDIGMNRAGLAHISLGEFSGNFLITDMEHYRFCIVSSSGNLVAEAAMDGFDGNCYEGLTEISSGPFQGKFAILGYFPEDYEIPHLVIFSLDRNEGRVTTTIWKDIIAEDLKFSPLAICFLPDDYPDPQYRNHFLISQWTYEYSPIDSFVMTIIDDNGLKKASHQVDYAYEGLAYIDKGRYEGKIAVCDYQAKDTWIGNADGTDKIRYDIKLGLGITEAFGFSWLPDTNQLLLIGWDTVSGSGISERNFYFLSRTGFKNWILDSERTYATGPGLTYDEIAGMMPSGYFYLLAHDRINGQPVYEVHRLNSNFDYLSGYPLGKHFFVICSLPDATQAENKLALVARGEERAVYLFDETFGSSQIIDLRGKVDKITDMYYDDSAKRTYILDSAPEGSVIRVFNPSWESIAECDISRLVEYRFFYHLTKTTVSDLKGSFILYSHPNSEMVIVDLDRQMTLSQIEKLIADIHESHIDQGIENSLAHKLKNAYKDIEKGKIQSAFRQILAFQNGIRAQSGEKIPAELADRWIERAQGILQSMESI